MQHCHRLFKRVAGASLGFAATLSFAQTTPPKEEAVITLEKFSVKDRITDPAVAIGTDSTRNTVAISREALLAAPAGISGLKMLETLPGFNVQTSDALGFYEFGNSVFVRAFKLDQIGFVVDGIPLGRNAAFGGSPIFRLVDNENFGRVVASQGAGDVSLPSYSSLGPAVTFTSLAPTKAPGFSTVLSAGDNSYRRTFFRVQSGERGGVSAYVSYSKIDGNLWNSPGTLNREHWEAKVRYVITPAADLTFKLVANKFHDFDSPSISKAQFAGTAGDFFGRSGRYFPYLGTVPDLVATTPGVAYSNTLHNQYYLQAINDRNDKLYGLTLNLRPADNLSFSSTAYYEDKKGYGVSPEAYATSLTNYNAEIAAAAAGVPGLTGLVAPRGLQYGLSVPEGDRYGLTGSGLLTSGKNKLEAGFWIERDNYHRTQNRYNQVGGNPAGAPLLNEPVHYQRDYRSRTETTQLFVKDTLALMDDKLKLEAGIKALDIDYAIWGARVNLDYRAGIRPKFTDNWSNYFLPQAGAVYSVTAHEQVFASYAENISRPVADDVYSAASIAATQRVEAEKAQNIEAGIRTNRGAFNGVLSVYSTGFRNRLQQFSALVPGSTQVESFFQNVGKVQAKGFEFSGGWRPAFLTGVALTAGGSYNIVEFKNNYTTQASATGAPTTVVIAGNTVPDSPKWMGNAAITYQPVGWLSANVSGRYTGPRYTNFINTETVAGYTIYSASLDFGGSQLAFGPFKSLKLRLNLDNVFDKIYLARSAPQPRGSAYFVPVRIAHFR